MERARWLATVFYRTDTGPLAVEHDLEEIADLDDMVEGGPHWDTIIEIKIVRAEYIDGPLTVEAAAKL